MNKKNKIIDTLHGAVFFTKTTCSHSEQELEFIPVGCGQSAWIIP